MQKRSKKSWSKLAARITLGLLVACGTLGWAQEARAEGETKFKITGWTDGKPVCDTSVSGFGQINVDGFDLRGKVNWALSNPIDPIYEVYYASTGGDPLKYTVLGKASLCGSYAKDASFSANNSKVVVTAGKLASVTGGAMSGNGKAENNIVEISGTAAIADSVSGAFSFGDANNNEVKINGAVLDINTINGAFLRGENTNGKGNSVLIDSESINAQTISGAKGHLASNINLTENTLTIKNANLGGYSNTDDIFIEIAGASTSGIRSDGSDSGSAERNTLELDNVTVGKDYILDAYGGFGNKNVEWNYVDIKNSTIENPYSAITGGFAYGGNVKDNTVSIENSTIKGLVYAAMAGAYGAKDVDATAISNKIILKGTLDLKEARLYAVNEQKMAYGKRSNALILDGLTSTNNSTEIRSINYFNYIDFGTVNLTSDNTSEHAYLKLSNDDKSNFLDEKTYLYGSVSGTGYLMTGYFDGSKLDVSDLKNKFLGGSSVQDYLPENGVKLLGYDVKIGYESLRSNNYVLVENGTTPIALAGVYTDGTGVEHINTGDSTSRSIDITTAPEPTVKIIAGAYNAATDSESAKAVNGKVSISNVKLDNSSNQSDKKIKLYGGYSINGGAENNQLIINNLSYKANNSLNFYGNYATKGDIKSEITAVEVSGGKVYDIYGNYSNMGGNIIGMENVPVVKLTNVTSCGTITGARIQTTDNSNIYKIENNEVLIQYDGSNSGTGAGSVIGTEGFSNYIAKNNKVTIDGKFTVNNITGVQQSKEAYGNTVIVKNGAVVNNNLYGIALGKEFASNNKVIINNATVKELVEGASANVKATGNAVEISNGSEVGSVIGVNTGDAENNTVFISDSSVTAEVVGHHYKAIATEKNDLVGKKNTIEISNSDVDGNVVGAMIISSDFSSLSEYLTGQGASTLEGVLTENNVIISGNSEVKNANDRYVAGAYINKEYTGVVSGDVVKNTVTIKDGAKVAPVIYGGHTIKGNAQNNSVTVKDNAEATGTIYGNYSMDGNATGDGEHANVSISGGAKFGNTYGGYSKNGQANSNIIRITGEGTTFNGNGGIFGGYSLKNGEANSNKVEVNGGAYISNVWGGSASVASGNIVTIGTEGDTTTVVNGDIYGASGINVSKNEVNLLGGSINNIWGAIGTTVEENVVTISGGASRTEYSGYIIGGEADSFSGDGNDLALNNIVNISSGDFKADVFGNKSGYGSAKGDGTRANVSISGGTIDGNIYGGSGNIAEKNIVSISGGTINGRYGGVIGGSGTTVSENKISITGGTINSKVTGGSGTTVSENKISISGGTINDKVTGGDGINRLRYTGSGFAANDSTVSGNIVEISGGTFGGEEKTDVYAGYSKTITNYGITSKGTIENNKIVITKGENFDASTSLANANLYGSNMTASETSGNALDVSALATETNINSINNFNTIIMGAGKLTLSEASNLSNTVIDVSKLADKTTARTLIIGDLNVDNVSFIGIEEAGKVGYNQVSDADVSGGVIKYVSGGAKATKEKITIEAGEAGNNIAGLYIDSNNKGYSYDDITTGTATSGTLKLGNVTIGDKIYAGTYAEEGNAAGGTVEINGSVDGSVYAGYAKGEGTVSGNTVKLTGSADASNLDIVGSNKVFDDNANNALDVTGWTAAAKTIGSVDKINSISFGDVALGETYMTISGGSLNGTVITAGNLSGEGYLISGVSTTGVNVEALKGEAGKDKITALTNGVQYAVTNGTSVEVKPTAIYVNANTPDTVKALTGVFYGDDGKAEKGITDGVLTLDGSVDPADDVIYAGAYAKSGKASGGTVKVTGDFEGTVYGGYSVDGSGTEDNTLEIDGSRSVIVNEIEAVDTIKITGKVVKNGEKPVLNVTNKADFTKTNVHIDDLDLKGAVKDTTTYKVISNADVDAAKVTIDNIAKVDDDVVKASIINKDDTDGLTLTYGGKVIAGSYTDETGTVTANGGVLKVSSIDNVEEDVIYAGAYSSNGTANGTVDLDNSFAGTLYGYYQANDENGSGTLNVRGKDLVVKEIANFNTINFFVPADMAKDGTVLKVESEVNIAGAKVNAGINNQSALDIGDEITLLEAVSLDATGIVAGKVTENDFIDYDMNIESLDNQLKAKITSKGISNENSKSPVETIAGSLVMLNMGAEQLAGKGFESAAEAVALEKATAPNCMTTFASISGNKVKAETGSHIDIKGWNFNLGFAKEIDNKSGKLLIAPLVEYGRGTYDSYVENNIGVVHADGTSKYWGAGMMARQTNENGFYYEGSLVAGKSTNDYSTKDIGSGISYETSAMYITAHLGAGKIVTVTDKDKLNFYGKFFYSRLGSDDTTLSNGAKYSFDTSESKRMRLGGRLTRELNEMNKLYAGMAWQYEFDAESRATVNGKTAQAPTMKGHTGILELGWKVKPGNSKFDVDLSFLGYTGKHKGGSINVNMNWNF